MKVAFISPAGALGGAERSLLDLISALRATAADIELSLVTLAAGPLVEKISALGVQVVVLPMPPVLARLGDSSLDATPKGYLPRRAALAFDLIGALPATVAYLLVLRRTLRRLAPDIVHANGLKAHLLAALTRPRRARLIWHMRDFLGRRRLARRLLRALAWRADCIIAISRAVADDLTRVLPGRRLAIVYNGIDVEAFRPDGATLAAVADGGPGVRIGLIATFALWKGHAVFIRAAGIATAALPPGAARFFLIGGPVYETRGGQVSEAALRALAGESAAPVQFLPFQVDPAPTLRALDVVVHASTAPEPFGRTIVEAMAAGRAVIAAAGGGVPELATDGIDALLVPPGDAEALAAAMMRLATDPELRRSLGAAGRRTAATRYARVRVGREVAALYRDLAG
jgi:glycosyltransferase involved in cell wall biosynthesis